MVLRVLPSWHNLKVCQVYLMEKSLIYQQIQHIPTNRRWNFWSTTICRKKNPIDSAKESRQNAESSAQQLSPPNQGKKTCHPFKASRKIERERETKNKWRSCNAIIILFDGFTLGICIYWNVHQFTEFCIMPSDISSIFLQGNPSFFFASPFALPDTTASMRVFVELISRAEPSAIERERTSDWSKG